LGLAFGLHVLALIFGQQLLRLVLEAKRLVELGLDAGAALVERVENAAVQAHIDRDGDENDESDRDPEFGVDHRSPHRLTLASTALSTAARAGCEPISRSTIAAAASTAMPRTLASAACLVAPIVFSASLSLALSS